MIVREATPDDAAQFAFVHIQSWKTTYRGMMPDEVLDNLDLPQITTRWKNTFTVNSGLSRYFVAEDEQGDIVGIAAGGPPSQAMEGYDCELYLLYLLESAQGEGIGRLIFRAAAKRLNEVGYTSLVLWVLAANAGARGFYEHMGGTYLQDGTYTVRDYTLNTVAYGWLEMVRLVD